MARPTKKQLQAEADAAANRQFQYDQTVAEQYRNQLIANFTPPVMVSEGSYSDVPARAKFNNGTIASTPFSGLYGNVRALKSPFNSGRLGWDVEEAIQLCVNAYWSFPLLKNTVDVMGELADSPIYLKGGNKKTRTLTAAWIGQTNMSDFKRCFMREFFRTGTIPIYRTDGEFDDTDLTKMTQVFGASLKNGKKTVPIRYTILNPVHIRVESSNYFDAPIYSKLLTPDEILRILNPISKSDKAYRKTFTPQQLLDMKNGSGTFTIPLDPERLYMVFYKKQPYEPLAVPMAFPLLQDINDKIEMKRKDADFVKKMDNALLLVNVGMPLDQYNTVSNSKMVTEHIQKFFSNQAISRVMVVDHTVKVEWKIPDVNKVLGTAKYEQIDKDLAVGLNAILFNSDEKFSNTSIKVQVFIQRLEEARQAFNDFLQEEVKTLCENTNAQTYPEIVFEEINLKDELQYNKMYVQLAQLGLLTPKELLEALDTGKIPTPEESLENQVDLLDQRKEGYYFPLLGGNNQLGLPNGTQYIPPVAVPAAGAVKPNATTKTGTTSPGRPTGKASTETPEPIERFVASKIVYFTSKAKKLVDKMSRALRESFEVKRLTPSQKGIAEELSTAIIANENEADWQESIASYISNPKEINENVLPEIESLAKEFQMSFFNANILRLSAVV